MTLIQNAKYAQKRLIKLRPTGLFFPVPDLLFISGILQHLQWQGVEIESQSADPKILR